MRLAGIDERDPLRRVFLGEESVQGNAGEIGVAIEGFTVGDRQLQSLHHGVDVRRRVVAQGPEVEVLQEVQGLQQDRGLGPGPLAADFVAAVTGAGRFLEFGPVPRQVLGAQNASGAAGAVHQGAGQVSLVVVSPGGPDALDSIPGTASLIGGQPPQRSSQAGLNQERPRPGKLPVLVEDLVAAGRVLVELVPGGLGVQSVDHVLVVRKPGLRQVDGRLQNLRQGEGSVSLQKRQQRVHHARNRKGEMGQGSGTGGDLVQSLTAKEVDRGQFGSRALAAQREEIAAVGVVEHEDRLGRQRVGGHRFGHRSREPGRHQRVEGVSAPQQHAHPGHGGQVVAAGNDPLGGVDHRPAGGGPSAGVGLGRDRSNHLYAIADGLKQLLFGRAAGIGPPRRDPRSNLLPLFS